ncbi:MAG: hypothetical protein ACTH5C_13840, partial [Pseudoalteromonas prydzensis]|uniref:hypothetical protein n=1 Tax=Pseudoalteromonas prydzensis TaxID=182141 RepID=UPI003F9C6817
AFSSFKLVISYPKLRLITKITKAKKEARERSRAFLYSLLAIHVASLPRRWLSPLKDFFAQGEVNERK